MMIMMMMMTVVPCESGYMYDCNSGECQQCPGGSYQPQWGQTSCWPCPANTTTDTPGAASLDMCKSHACPFYAREGVGIMESPNYPRQFPVSHNNNIMFSCRQNRYNFNISKSLLTVL